MRGKDSEFVRSFGDLFSTGSASILQTRSRHRQADPDFSVIAEQYCGIRNQGATCYMNSILQAFYHIPAFRRIIFEMPRDGSSPRERSMIYNLQRLFGLMQTQTDAVSTKPLTRSFGWEHDEHLDQQDIHEFMTVVIESIEEKLRGTTLELPFARLFRGQTRSYVRCHDVDFTSERFDKFHDISLVVKGCANLQESLRCFLTAENLDGENQYEAGIYGKQNATIGIEFLEFPAVLYFHLRRLEYDNERQCVVKIKSRYEFPEAINMADYLAGGTASDRPLYYDLFGVLVHSGEAEEGHFYAFLRTSPDDRWFKFNDNLVSVASVRAALYENYGGNNGPKKGNFSAYMLIYVRRADVSDLFCHVPRSMIPDLRPDNTDSEPLVSLSIFTEASIVPQSLSFDYPARVVHMQRSTSFLALYERVAAEFQCSDIRLWYCHSQGLVSPLRCDRLFTIQHHLLGASLFVERVEYSLVPDLAIVFCAFYHPYEHSKSPLRYIGLFAKTRDKFLMRLTLEMNSHLGLPLTTKIGRAHV
jgi:ubiquitin carboxyl-terminal hydrolase 7